MPVVLDEADLFLIKKLELNICQEIKRICEKHDIMYSIGFGTLLGAIRHQGFIPWDDDIDIAMLRSEYDRFLEIAALEMDPSFEIVNYETSRNFGEPFTKIMLKNTVMLECFAKNANAPCGVFVDIIPFDNAPDSKLQRLWHRAMNYQLRKRILLASGYDFRKTGLKSMVYDLLSFSARGKKATLVRKYRRNQAKYDQTSTASVVALGGNYGYTKDTLPREWFDSYKTVSFEGIQFSAFEKTEEFLTHYYGDYMKLPPESQRINKHTVELLDLSAFGGRKTGDGPAAMLQGIGGTGNPEIKHEG